VLISLELQTKSADVFILKELLTAVGPASGSERGAGAIGVDEFTFIGGG
jgi:hypothetical protein